MLVTTARRRAGRALAAGAGASLALALTAAPTTAAEPEAPRITSAKNLDLGSAGRVVVAGSTAGGVDVVRFLARADLQSAPVLASLPAGSPVAAQDRAGRVWVAYGAAPEDPAQPGGAQPARRLSGDGRVQLEVDLAGYQASDPDPFDLEGNPGESNPYDVEALNDGSALVVDAAGNDLLRIDRHGRVRTVACFPTQVFSTEGAPSDPAGPPLPPELPVEAVPTGVSYDPATGDAYVSELKGFPFPVGGSRVWRVDADGHRQGCDGGDPGVVVADGLTAANDVTYSRQHLLFVTQLHDEGVLALEAGFEDPASVQGTGSVVQIAPDGTRTSLGDGQLTAPGSVAVDRARVYVVDAHLFAPSVRRIG